MASLLLTERIHDALAEWRRLSNDNDFDLSVVAASWCRVVAVDIDSADGVNQRRKIGRHYDKGTTFAGTGGWPARAAPACGAEALGRRGVDPAGLLVRLSHPDAGRCRYGVPRLVRRRVWRIPEVPARHFSAQPPKPGTVLYRHEVTPMSPAACPTRKPHVTAGHGSAIP